MKADLPFLAMALGGLLNRPPRAYSPEDIQTLIGAVADALDRGEVGPEADFPPAEYLALEAIREAATGLLNDLAARHGVTTADQFPTPQARALALAIGEYHRAVEG